MTILLLLIPVALCLGLLALTGFLWSMKSGQFDDLEKESFRILFNGDDLPKQKKRTKKVLNERHNYKR